MRKQVLSIAVALAATSALGVGAQETIVSTFNPDNVILPCSQYTPADQWSGQVCVVNTGNRYSEQHYNRVWGAPADDAAGNPWYAPDYELTDGADASWQTATAPFSSDEYYKGKKSFRWITVEIMGDIYIRRSFTLTKPVEKNIFLACGHDDAPSEWYINGVLVHTVADGWNNDEYVLLTDEQKSLLHFDGTPNIIALHVHQNWGGAYADCGLYEADMTRQVPFLNTIDNGEAWPCRYYLMNRNEEFAEAEAGKWFAPEEDERDWMAGVGPFSNDENKFYVTPWPSSTHPILVRRHFSLTAAQLEAIKAGKLYFTCSYDEYPTAYLNGTKFWSADGWNDNNYATTQLSQNVIGLLREGDNLLAVSARQGSGGGHLDYGLMLSENYTPSGVESVITDSAKNARPGVYDLMGRYLGADASALTLQSGFYIINGKKTFIK